MTYKKLIINSALFLSFVFSNTQAALIDFTGNSVNDIDTFLGDSTQLVINTHGDISDLNISYALGHSMVNVGPDNFNHVDGAFAAEVTVTLTHINSGLSLQLYDSQTPFLNNQINVTIDDEAPSILPTSSTSDWVGTYQAYNGDNSTLSLFDGIDIFGTWELSFYDAWSPFTDFNGTDLISWGLEATLVDDTDVNVPEPPMIAVIIVLLALIRFKAFPKS